MEEGPADRKYGVLPNQYPSYEWRTNGTTGINQAIPESVTPEEEEEAKIRRGLVPLSV